MHSSSINVNQQADSNPSASSTSTRDAKLEQIIQNFYTKTAQVIIQGRTTASSNKRASIRGYGSSSKKLNNWFNIGTEDIALLREELKYWRSLASTDQQVMPLTIDIYLDTSKISAKQTLSAVDDNLRWGCVDVNSVDHILIETWVLTLKSPFGYNVDLPNLYKRSIIFFRSLHSFVRLLPTYDLYRKIRKASESNPLSIGYRLSSNPNAHYSSEIPLDSNILENDARKPTSHHVFSDIVTPMGTFNLSVTYRRNCDFKVEDRERDLSAKFLDMDEQFFTPTVRKYEEEYSKARPTTPKESTSKESISSSKAPRDIYQNKPRSSSSISSSSRRTSAAFTVTPFKSPFLSSSPQAESLFSTTAVSKQSTPFTGSRQGLDSGSFGRKIEFSSSFDKYKSSPTGRIPDSPSLSSIRRLSRASDISFMSQEEDELKDFVRMMTPSQEQKLFHPRNSSTPLSTDTSGSDMANSMSGSLISKRAALSHFQTLRDTHTSLSESLSSSIMMANNNNETGTSPVSSTSSAGRSYQPTIPLPSQAQKRSTSPVHIPRSYPQFRSVIPNQANNALGIAKINDDERDSDLSAYSTYPQDSLHQDLHTMDKSKTTKESEDNLGHSSKENHNSLDDDDSLMFKMSELGCESPAPTSEQQIFYSRTQSRIPEKPISLTKEKKPTSPPLLEHINKNTEDKSDSSNDPMPRLFDAW
ncbi:autophagy-related protein 13-domain-containing protein [Sporodiniella umbellata]|nr:autophagy-related protein 13-domain-containing protein [Sporodiniella umbellata]